MKRVISLAALVGSLLLVTFIEQSSKALQRAAGSNFRMEESLWILDGAVLASAIVTGTGLWLANRYGEQSRRMCAGFVVVGLALWLASTPPGLSLWASIDPSQFPRTVIPTLSILPGSLVTMGGGIFATFGTLNLLRPPAQTMVESDKHA